MPDEKYGWPNRAPARPEDGKKQKRRKCARMRRMGAPNTQRAKE